MKKITLIAVAMLCLLNSVHAQEVQPKQDIYRTWIKLNKEPFEAKGVLYEIKDSSILMSTLLSNIEVERDSTKNYTVELNISDIDEIKVRKNNQVGTAVLIGAVAGFTFGALTGYISGDDPPCSQFFCLWNFTARQKALFTGVPLLVLGAGIGASVVFAKVSIPIDGSIDKYNEKKNMLKDFSYINE